MHSPCIIICCCFLNCKAFQNPATLKFSIPELQSAIFSTSSEQLPPTFMLHPSHPNALADQVQTHRLLVLHFILRHPGVAPVDVRPQDEVLGMRHHGCRHLVQLAHLKPWSANNSINTQ